MYQVGVFFSTRMCYCDGFYSIVTFVSTLYELPSITLQHIWFVKKGLQQERTIVQCCR